jgi:omega-amidase
MRLALSQMQILPGNLPGNLKNAEGMITAAAAQNAELVLLPELWSTGYDLSHAAEHAAANQEITQTVSDLARKHHIWIGGSLLETINGKIFNTFSLIDPQGNRRASYNKIHLFKLMEEDRWLNAGDNPTITQLSCGNTGLAICYDLRFPELFRHYAIHGARLILISAEWPLVRIDHWRTLLRARAIENQLFIAAVNAVSDSDGTVMGGQSMAIDPWGDIAAEGSATEEHLILAELDFDLVNQVRQTIPALTDRRPEVY